MFAVNIHHLSPAYTAVFVYLHDPPKRCKRALRKSAVSLIIPHSHIAFLHINRDGKESGFFPSLFSDMGLILTNPLIAWVLSFSDRARYSCREKRRFCRPDRAGSRLPRCPFCRRRAASGCIRCRHLPRSHLPLAPCRSPDGKRDCRRSALSPWRKVSSPSSSSVP